MHVRTCATRFHISVTAGWIGLKFVRWLGIHYTESLQKSEVGCICTCARALDIPFPLRARSFLADRGVLLVIYVATPEQQETDVHYL